MFGKSKLKVGRISTVVGQGTEISGDITFHESIHIDGTVKGSVKAASTKAIIIISELGIVEGDLHAPIVILNGTVKGNVFASERLDLAEHAKIEGDLTYKLLEMAVGAEINGRLLHVEETARNQPLLESKVDSAKADENATESSLGILAHSPQDLPAKS